MDGDSPSPTTGFSFIPALKSDIPALVQIHMAAFANENLVRLMFKSLSEYSEKVQGMLESQIPDPDYSVIKAISTSTDEIFGWLGCGWVGYPSSHDGSVGKEAEIPANPLGAGESRAEDGERTLRSVMNADFARVQDEWMSGKQYIHIGTAVVHPSHQRQGVGSALVGWATSRADAERVPCWVQSSPIAHGVYYRCGFRDVGRLELDLREFVAGGKNGILGKSGWGPFELVHMLRLAEIRG